MTSPAMAQFAVKTQRDILTPMADHSAPIVRVKKTRFVPMLPVRYALGIDDSKSPEVAGPFQMVDSDGTAMPKGGKIHYTLRRLRSGYLHVYSETDQDWFSFLARPEGGELQLLKAPAKYTERNPEQGTPGNVAQAASPESPDNACPQPSPLKTSATGMLLLPDDYPVWLAFSDAMWTDKVFGDFKEPERREKHMRKFDPEGWTRSWAGLKHTAPLQDAAQRVADVKGQLQLGTFMNTLGRDAFWFSRDPFLRMRMDALNCMEVSPEKTVVHPKIMERGAVLALEDPSGIAMDLAALMIKRYEAWTEAKDPVFRDHPLKRREAVAAAIVQIRGAIQTQAEYDALTSQQANKATGYAVAKDIEDHTRLAGLGAFLAKRHRAEIEREHSDAVIARKVEASRERAWEKYAVCYDPGAIEAWKTAIKPHAERFNATRMIPLTAAHTTWMKSQRLAEYCSTHYDSHEPESGLVYTRMIERCIGGIQDKGNCEALLQEWLQGRVDDRSNLLLRALVLNQDTLVKGIQRAAHSGASIPWKDLFDVFAKEYDRVKHAHEDVLVRLLAQIMGAVITVLDESGSRTLLAIAGAICRKPIVRQDLTGSKEAFLRALLETAFNQAEPASGKLRIKDLVDKEVDLLKVKGEPLDQEFRISCLLVVDPEGVHGMPAGLETEEQIAWFTQNIRTPDQFKALPVWKNAVYAGRRFLSTNAPALLGVVTALFQFHNMKTLSESLKKSMSHKVEDHRWRFYMSVGAFAGAILGLVGTALKYGAMPLKLGRGITALALARGAELAGEAFAGLTGLVAAGMDVRTAAQEYKKGHLGLIFLNIGSAVAGAGASVLFFLGFYGAWQTATATAAVEGGAAVAAATGSSWLAASAAALTGWGILLAIVGMVIAAVISEYTNNPMQDWLERCVFHKQPSASNAEKAELDFYPNMYVEFNNLKLATTR